MSTYLEAFALVFLFNPEIMYFIQVIFLQLLSHQES